MTYKRNRLLYGIMIIVVMFLGLLSRKMDNIIPDILSTYLGDSLWALMIFVGFGFVFRYLDKNKVGIIGIIFCYIIELSQLYQSNWINNIRETTLGGLVLGHGFLFSDLIAYGIGIGIGVALEHLFYNKSIC